ncbi:N-acetyl-D-Glu racemase DgcA [Novosphingobium terrae]|uniref:N-acetyl-D-Glu racemase DgcA n=1 Tax=Novosphingobium terrae TaxID=2726189 RepID=UPI001F147379|nr:N-acetyl-D-Glu racemase DgcA [Novosphingobium terrae]
MSIRGESLPLSRPFRISRGAKTSADVVVVELAQGGMVGRGECVPYGRYQESCASVMAQLEGLQGQALDRAEVQHRLPPGAARNALDCALWDLEAKLSGVGVAQKLGIALPPSLPTALTVTLDTPGAMAAQARALGKATLIKIKVDDTAPLEQIHAVRQAAPEARLIVDPNEAWSPALLADALPELADLRVDLLEQPIPAAQSEALATITPLVPICADEACHTSADLPALVGRYQFVNIKLDKAGGLTEALSMLSAARAMGFGVMTGCMTASSLSIAPAMLIGAQSDFCDLDGAMLMVEDRPGAMPLRDGQLWPAAKGFWG